MKIEQKLYQILSPFVSQLYPISAPLGIDPPYTVYRIIARVPLNTQDGSVTDLRHWEIQFTTFGSPGAQYAAIDGVTQTIMDTLLPYRDTDIQSITLKDGRAQETIYDTHYKLDASMVEFDIWESIA